MVFGGKLDDYAARRIIRENKIRLSIYYLIVNKWIFLSPIECDNHGWLLTYFACPNFSSTLPTTKAISLSLSLTHLQFHKS